MPDHTPPNTYFARGGARIGWVNYSWPLASLSVNSSSLTIVTTMFGLFEMGRYHFTPTQVIRIERFGSIPLIGEGIRLHHTVTDYPEKVVFWCRPSSVLSGIASTGFKSAPSSGIQVSTSSRRGFPLRIWPLAIMVIGWNLLLGFEFFSQSHFALFSGPCTVAALILAFLTSLAVLRFPRVQKVFLRPGHSIGEIRPMFLLIATITGFMALVFTSIYLAGGFRRLTKANKALVPTAGASLSSLLCVAQTPHPVSTLTPAPAVGTA
jgi:hypothetical protein